ncbi:hypothetical protein [Christiangramia sp. SM2212]|uniref:Uncharacterized protein n=1 Tax=Christiangramia sediminicola TaxID=3073267 RepID=A0ABU1ENE8_9FLAO|nr:hypothetical protein [Christiangramia sp. SM2212]MDR5589915.1 hypothetical protein [Christiangramia sp. SM2212]
MAVERGPKSLHEHNKSLLYSNRPKFKEDIRDNIYVDKPRNDGLGLMEISEEDLELLLTAIRHKARTELNRQFKMMLASIGITIIILIYLKEYLDYTL